MRMTVNKFRNRIIKKKGAYMRKLSIISIMLFIFFIMPNTRTAMSSDDYAGIDTCLGCHDDKAEGFNNSLHGKKINPRTPAAQEGCESCHGPGMEHANKGGGKGVGGIFSFDKKLDADSRAAKCLACHAETTHLAFWDNGRHKSAGIACNDCHSIHHGGEKLLKAAQPDICFSCHKDIRTMVNKQSHHPIKEGRMSCTSCHNPHGGFGEKMIKADSVNDLCYECHAEKRGPFRWEHPPVVENCLNCHQVHGSNHNYMLVRKPPQLCQSCHESFPHAWTLYNSTNAFKGSSPDSHFVARACLNCHTNIHGSNSTGIKSFRR